MGDAGAGESTRHARIAVHWAVALRDHPASLAVAIILSSHARLDRYDGRRVCWVGEEKIAQLLGIEVRAVRKSIRVLKEAGFIEEQVLGFRKTARLYLRDYEPKDASARTGRSSRNGARIERAGEGAERRGILGAPPCEDLVERARRNVALDREGRGLESVSTVLARFRGER